MCRPNKGRHSCITRPRPAEQVDPRRTSLLTDVVCPAQKAFLPPWMPSPPSSWLYFFDPGWYTIDE